MAEKKQRRERLSVRDHHRSVAVAGAAHNLLNVLQQLYPDNMQLLIALPAVYKFMGDTTKVIEQLEAGGGDAEPVEAGS